MSWLQCKLFFLLSFWFWRLNNLGGEERRRLRCYWSLNSLLLPATAFCWNVPPLISHLLPLSHVPPLIPSLLGNFPEVYLLQIHAYIIRTYTKISLSQTYTDRQCLYKCWWVVGKRVKLWQSDKAKGAVMTYLNALDYDKYMKGWTCSEICFQGFKSLSRLT